MVDTRGAAQQVTEKQKHRVMMSLEAQFGEAVDHHVLEAVVDADFAMYDDAHVKDFVPVLVEKDVRARILRRPALVGRAEV